MKKSRHLKRGKQGSNSYIDTFTSSKNYINSFTSPNPINIFPSLSFSSYLNSTLPDYPVSFNIDLIVLSSIQGLPLIDTPLKNKEFKVVKDIKMEKGNFARQRIYTNGAHKISVFHKLKEPLGYVKLLIFVYQPSEELLNSLNDMFATCNIETSMTKIELAWDFYPDNPWELRDFFATHLFLKHSRTSAFGFKNTFYTNRIRGASKGVRIYPKMIGGQWATRLELELSHSVLKRLDVTFPPTLESLDYTRFFEFRRLDVEWLYRYELWRNRKKIKEALRNNDHMTLSLMKTFIVNWIVNAVCGKSLMEAVECLKGRAGVPRHHRFFKPMDWENMVVKWAVEEKAL